METRKKRFENLVKVGHKARKDAGDFLNRWLNDSTKGWAVRTHAVGQYEDDFAVPLAVRLN